MAAGTRVELGTASANRRAALLLAFPLLIVMVAMFDRAGGLKYIWPLQADRLAETSEQKPARVVAAPTAPVVALPTLEGIRPKSIASRQAMSALLSGPSSRLDSVAMNRSPTLQSPQSRLTGAKPEAPLEPSQFVAARRATPTETQLPRAAIIVSSRRFLSPLAAASPLKTSPKAPFAIIASPLPPQTPAAVAALPLDHQRPAATLTLPAPLVVLPETPPLVAAPQPVPSIIEPLIATPATAVPSILIARPFVPPGGLIENTEFGPLVAVALPSLPAKDDVRVAAALTQPLTFGEQLAIAAYEQTKKDVTYDPRYVRISYPMGDVPENIGVCTDVVVRAYRVFGIDLQQLVQTTRSGTGDTNIDHRRVIILRKFLEKHGQSLPITDFPEDYKPGDLVTYFKPFGRTSKFHIAIVSDRLTPDGRPLIIHNRGYGAKLEDALFRERITGHYRYERLLNESVASRRPSPTAILKAAMP